MIALGVGYEGDIMTAEVSTKQNHSEVYSGSRQRQVGGQRTFMAHW
jgi:hypothetical protein